ncbi:hypothetical protein NDU88_002983 [Pleurodeles waltl]|uniref:Uncharacterized protein n=1 Tax=Pleurodeles waltl TaxID=8319 RepID=A0AAV7T3G8_PLEWA|nr:hypothetical protein NDU88_002983 [Pleurodeles waltl]
MAHARAAVCMKEPLRFLSQTVPMYVANQGNKAKCSQDPLAQRPLMEQLRQALPVAQTAGQRAHSRDFLPFLKRNRNRGLPGKRRSSRRSDKAGCGEDPGRPRRAIISR